VVLYKPRGKTKQTPCGRIKRGAKTPLAQMSALEDFGVFELIFGQFK
jgi:hypothetical protein